MGVIYKLREEVVQFIITERQSSPLASCRQLAESASQKFGLHLSKSSVHGVLKESGIITPRGRKPRPKFQIPQEKKKQIQISLAQVKLLPDPVKSGPLVIPPPPVILSEAKDLKVSKDSSASNCESPVRGHSLQNDREGGQKDTEISPEYDGAGSIFLKAALWDIGIFSQENIKEMDLDYYLTYSKGIKVVLENNKSFFIDLPLPLERCIREAVDGFINNVKPFIVHKVSDEGLFKACMNGQAGFKIEVISIVGCKDHILLEFSNIMEQNRAFILKERIFMESYERNMMERSKALFFPQLIYNNGVIEKILSLKGFNSLNKNENVVTLLVDNSYENKIVLQEAAEKLNEMYIYDEQGRIVRVIVRPLSEANGTK